ncbi:MAG: thiol-disulfide oxidoreductase DCC family protein [Candidatus Kapaibacteriota bacterium]|jgi:predicted DCC family thiol-disulfide oxidoreductase YuxK
MTPDTTATTPFGEHEQIVFFDGVCNLCNATVNWLIDHDPHQRLRFAPLQGITFDLLRKQHHHLPTNDLSTVILYTNNRFTTHSKAALQTIAALGGFWRIAVIGLIVPAFIRDAVYRTLARNRYRWFGKSESCRIPTPELARRFLP